jgi:hypothetical protein
MPAQRNERTQIMLRAEILCSLNAWHSVRTDHAGLMADNPLKTSENDGIWKSDLDPSDITPWMQIKKPQDSIH